MSFDADQFLEDVSRSPRRYKTDPDPSRTSHRVTFIEDGNYKPYIFKRPGLLTSLFLGYYRCCDQGFSARVKCSAWDALDEEARKLRVLADCDVVPNLVAYKRGKGLIRELILGRDFRRLKTKYREATLDSAMDGLDAIHAAGVAIGGAHVKNIVYNIRKKRAYWVDFDGVYDESNLVRAQARDLLAVVASTWSTSKDEELTRRVLARVNREKSPQIQGAFADIFQYGSRKALPWTATGIPLTRPLRGEIFHALMS